ncbi:MAG TPA: DUF885 family protein, partial [Sphingomicrobium sp.]|nr:DUF885 family protein [Sphingomicrobium sp.]
MNQPQLTRRQTVAALAATAAFPLIAKAAPANSAPASDAQARALLDSIAENLLRLEPESATSLGIDKGPRASYRYRLGDRSAAGQARIAATLKADLARAERINTAALPFATKTSVEVVKSAYRTALEGFAQPYGDVAVGGWRNTPYVVIQNVGAYIDTPQFLDTDHPIENRADAEAYLSRLAQYPAQLDGEVARMRAARAKGLVPPNFLIDKALNQLGIALKNTQAGGTIVDSLVRRTKEKGIPGDWDTRARKIATSEVAPRLQRQIEELQAERAVATDVAGMWSRPHGNEYYRWALKASTTTNLS